MGYRALNNLLGTTQNSNSTQLIAQELSKVLGKSVNIAPGKVGGRTDENGRVWLNDVDADEIQQNLIGEYK